MMKCTWIGLLTCYMVIALSGCRQGPSVPPADLQQALIGDWGTKEFKNNPPEIGEGWTKYLVKPGVRGKAMQFGTTGYTFEEHDPEHATPTFSMHGPYEWTGPDEILIHSEDPRSRPDRSYPHGRTQISIRGEELTLRWGKSSKLKMYRLDESVDLRAEIDVDYGLEQKASVPDATE